MSNISVKPLKETQNARSLYPLKGRSRTTSYSLIKGGWWSTALSLETSDWFLCFCSQRWAWADSCLHRVRCSSGYAKIASHIPNICHLCSDCFFIFSLSFSEKKKKSLSKYSSPLGSSNFGLDMSQVIYSENSMIFLLEEYFFNGGLKTVGGPWPTSKSSIYGSLVDRVGQEEWMRTQWSGNGGEQGG